ncbi:MAG: type I DNA topoisomerase [Holosporales bacterium]|nr:type I DNA topoisomerase [Holosporales bacterium]
MLKGIVIVESPAKAKTLETYLGKDYKVIASYGHIRDLVSKNGSVDTNNHYKMLWEFNERGKRQIKEISDCIKTSDNLFLATDPDREGEAISWHILEVLNEKKALTNKNVKRVVFHEITKSAVQKAFNSPKELNQNLINAYLARRVLDYLVGFSLSPVLWRKMPGAKSAGRVQSVALRLIVERELEIQAFKPEEYWSIFGIFSAENGIVTASLTHFDGEKLEKLSIKTEEEANKIKELLDKKEYFVDKIEKKSLKRNPYAPFTTSTLQQDAVRKLGFSSKKTMQIAQKLYEGILINGAMNGLITYMRTDSVVLSNEAIEGSRNYIESEYGKKYLPESPRIYKTKTKNAQEAHEAIRPTSFSKSPNSIKQFLSEDEYSLYDLIWKRTISSQMESAIIDQITVNILSKDKKARFKVVGSTVAFDGFLKLYVESTDNDKDEKSEKLPILKEKEELELNKIDCQQHFTQPPPRFNEASLVKKLEDLGIGRPSTYATIINVLQERGYAALQRRTFFPESIGYLTTSFLRSFFSRYVQYDFTATLEEELDDISNGKLFWEKVIDEFWVKFNNEIQKSQELSISTVIELVEKDIGSYVFKDVDSKRECPICREGKINLKLGKYGAFLGCSKYPECKYTKKLGIQSLEEGNQKNHTFEKIEVGKWNGEAIFFKKGPYGYYFEWEKTKDEKGKKPKRVSIPKFISDPTELSLEDAITLSQLPKNLGKEPNANEDVILTLGRFGPFLKIGKQSIKLEKDINFLRMKLENALKLI